MTLSTCLLLTEDGEALCAWSFRWGFPARLRNPFTVPKGEGALGIVFASARVRQVESPRGTATENCCRRFFSARGSRRALIVPLKADGRVIGAAFYGSQTVKDILPKRRSRNFPT